MYSRDERPVRHARADDDARSYFLVVQQESLNFSRAELWLRPAHNVIEHDKLAEITIRDSRGAEKSITLSQDQMQFLFRGYLKILAEREAGDV